MGADAHPAAATRPARPTRRCTPRRSTCSRRSRANNFYVPTVADPLAPVTFVHKIKRAGVPGLPVDRRADRRPLPRRSPSASRAPTASGSPSPTAPTSTRSTRRRSTAGTTSSSSTSPSARRGCRPRVKALAPMVFQHRHGRPGRDAARRPDPGAARPTRAALAAFEALPPVRILFDNGAGSRRRARPSPGFEQSFAALPAARARRARSWYLGRRRHAARRQAAGGAATTRSPGTRPPGRATELHRQHRLGRRRPVDRDAALPLDPEPGGHARCPT